MDEQRLKEYLNLIQALIECPDGREAEILEANRELVDMGLVQVMEREAATIAEKGEPNAGWLQNLAAQLTAASATLKEYFKFLMEVLLAVSRNPTPEATYPLLQRNLDKLDENLGQVLQDWAKAKLPDVELEQRQDIAGDIVNFSTLIQKFRLGNRAANLEIAIAGYEVAADVFTRKAFPQDWATTQNNLAIAYRNRIRGERADNLEAAISGYQNALEVRTREAFPQDWAMTQNNLANAYNDRIRGERADNLEAAIAGYQNALEVRTREAFPQDWAMTQNNLANAYNDRIRGERADNLEAAIAGYRNALEVLTPTTFPLECLGTGGNLGKMALALGNWELAIQGYGKAISAVEQSRSWATSDESRQEILANSIGIYENMVQACINNGQLNKAIEYAERSRSQRPLCRR